MIDDVSEQTSDPNIDPDDESIEDAMPNGSDTDATADDERIDEIDPAGDEIDLAGMEADLDGVQAALARLADGSYWTDEVTGQPIPAEVLESNPLARRA